MYECMNVYLIMYTYMYDVCTHEHELHMILHTYMYVVASKQYVYIYIVADTGTIGKFQERYLK